MIYSYLIENFCTHVHEWYWPVILLFGGVFVLFWNQNNAGLIEWVWNFSFHFFISWSSLRRIDVNSSLNVCRIPPGKPSGPGLLFVVRFLIIDSISLLVVVCSCFLLLPLPFLVFCMCLGNYPFLPYCSICGQIIFLNILLLLFIFL